MPRKQPYEKPVLVRKQRLGQVAAGQVSNLPVPSDRRLKTDIERVGTAPDGVKLYAFRYFWSEQRYVGVMAQDLLEQPSLRGAVSVGIHGFYEVDYGALGLRMVPNEDQHYRYPKHLH